MKKFEELTHEDVQPCDAYAVDCRSCGDPCAEWGTTREDAANTFNALGWRIDKNGHIYCPKCVEVMGHHPNGSR